MPVIPGFASPQTGDQISAIFARQQQAKQADAELEEAKKQRRQQLALGIANLLIGGGLGSGGAAGLFQGSGGRGAFGSR